MSRIIEKRRAFVRHVSQCVNSWNATIVIASGTNPSTNRRDEITLAYWDQHWTPDKGSVVCPYVAGDVLELRIAKLSNRLSLPNRIVDVEMHDGH
jgi:hypothetical protein